MELLKYFCVTEMKAHELFKTHLYNRQNEGLRNCSRHVFTTNTNEGLRNCSIHVYITPVRDGLTVQYTFV